MEDLDRLTSRRELAIKQLSDLAVLDVTSDVDVVFQSERFEIYRHYLGHLVDRSLVYECYCSRKEIQDAARAPHGAFSRYPGTCRELTIADRARRARHRPAALRLKAGSDESGKRLIDDVVLVRNDGVPAYNLAVVVDDELQGITQVVRGEDLLHVTAPQRHLQSLLGFRDQEYVHVPLLRGPDGERLSKRHGDVTLSDCLRLGFSPERVREALLRSLDVGSDGWGPSSSLGEWLESLL